MGCTVSALDISVRWNLTRYRESDQWLTKHKTPSNWGPRLFSPFWVVNYQDDSSFRSIIRRDKGREQIQETRARKRKNKKKLVIRWVVRYLKSTIQNPRFSQTFLLLSKSSISGRSILKTTRLSPTYRRVTKHQRTLPAAASIPYKHKVHNSLQLSFQTTDDDAYAHRVRIILPYSAEERTSPMQARYSARASTHDYTILKVKKFDGSLKTVFVVEVYWTREGEIIVWHAHIRTGRGSLDIHEGGRMDSQRIEIWGFLEVLVSLTMELVFIAFGFLLRCHILEGNRR